MRRRTTALIGCGTGLVGGFGFALLVGAADRPTDGGRYQLHVWESHTPNANPDHGAYRIDTQTGEVYLIESGTSTYKLDFK